MTRILVFGDSIAYGAWDEEGGWVERLKKFIHKRNMNKDNDEYDEVFNFSVGGEDTGDVLNRFEEETSTIINEDEECIIIFAIGTNDSHFYHNENRLQVKPEQFKKNIKKLISLAKNFSSKIIFINYTFVDESMTTLYNDLNSYKNEYIQEYNNNLKEICAKNNVHFIDIYKIFVKKDYKKLLYDGLHPNSEGHKLIYETVKDFLIKNKLLK
ncbi:hypothetical protein JW949_00780 [Candidatus Woesearchaeota archaeon]|nr:hypothetical protein [Candidatus Woesearchaeota archaeon]